MVTQTTSPSVRKTAPGPRNYPIIGCFPQMVWNPLPFLTNAARQYGDVVHLGAIGPQQLYLVAHPDCVKYVLQENPQNYTKGENFKEMKLVIGEGLVISEGDHWRRQRRFMQPTLHRQQIEAMVRSMTTVIAEMLEQWCGIEHAQPIEVSSQMLYLTQKIVMKALLSVEGSSETTELIQAWNTAFTFLSDRTWALLKLPVSLPTPKNLQFQQAVRTLQAFADRVIREHQQNGNDYHDMLSMLLNARDESGVGMSNQELHDQIMGIFSAGFETSAAVLGWVWYLLSKHPDVERKLQAELDAVLGGRTPTFEDIPNLKYTKMVIEESMRLYPGAWIFSRTNIADDEIGGYHIPARSMVVLSPFVTQRLSAFWENPEGFDPERFAPERSIGRPRYAYFPFSGGPRQCLGDIFAITEIQLVVAMVSQRFRLNLVPEHPVERNPILTLQPRHGILMTLEPRSGAGNTSQLGHQKALLA